MTSAPSLGNTANMMCTGVVCKNLEMGYDSTQSLASGTGCVQGPMERPDGLVWTLSGLLQLRGGHGMGSSMPRAQATRTPRYKSIHAFTARRLTL